MQRLSGVETLSDELPSLHLHHACPSGCQLPAAHRQAAFTHAPHMTARCGTCTYLHTCFTYQALRRVMLNQRCHADSSA